MNGEWKWEDAWNLFILLSIVVLDFSVAFLITVFLKFHIKLLLENKTTIENLEQKGKGFKSVYDKGTLGNFNQVFGTNKYLWAFPMYADSGKPLGDGIYWSNSS